MTWRAYRVVFKLKSPMHIGCGKVGNVQRTRPYVTGRVFWGALTMRLTRDATSGSATDSNQYKTFGDQVNSHLAFTYFYPAIAKLQENHSEGYEIAFPWDNESQFRRRFLSSYASTALVYPRQAADEGLLHEVEFLSPRTLDEGKQVYLIGYVFEKEGSNLQWQDACQRLQMGGERGYGWGDVQLIEKLEPIMDSRLFNSENYSWQEQNGSILIRVSANAPMFAHASSTGLAATGEIEPLVGREWKVSHQAGQHVEKFGDDICWIPGSVVERDLNFVVRGFGIWHLPD
ncbi:MAG: hypothetical protein IGS48_23880 [Oscillatoriales cyanobacterium C42_A2020_001]|nr:hypothetical protein [Leptolyngbyaceae cyanobacterium C42_A2020_001]